MYINRNLLTSMTSIQDRICQQFLLLAKTQPQANSQTRPNIVTTYEDCENINHCEYVIKHVIWLSNYCFWEYADSLKHIIDFKHLLEGAPCFPMVYSFPSLPHRLPGRWVQSRVFIVYVLQIEILKDNSGYFHPKHYWLALH